MQDYDVLSPFRIVQFRYVYVSHVDNIQIVSLFHDWRLEVSQVLTVQVYVFDKVFIRVWITVCINSNVLIFFGNNTVQLH